MTCDCIVLFLLLLREQGKRGGKVIPLKITADAALVGMPDVKVRVLLPNLSSVRDAIISFVSVFGIQTVLVCKRTGHPCHMQEGRDFWMDTEMVLRRFVE